MKWHEWLTTLDGLSSSDIAIVERLLSLYPVQNCDAVHDNEYPLERNRLHPNTDNKQLSQDAKLIAALLFVNQQHLSAGNTCLRLDKIANKRFFHSQADASAVDGSGSVVEGNDEDDVTDATSLEHHEPDIGVDHKPGILLPSLEMLLI